MVPRLRSWRPSYSHARMVLETRLVSRGLRAHVRVHVTKGEKTYDKWRHVTRGERSRNPDETRDQKEST